MTAVKTLCSTYGVCRDTGCVDCPNKDRPRTTLVAGVNWPSEMSVVTAPQGKRVAKEKPPTKPRVPKEKPLDTTLDYFKEARDFIAPRIKPEAIVSLVRLYRDEEGTVIRSEEVIGVPQAVITGANPYNGARAIPFNDGFRAAERIYGIIERKKRTA